MDWFIVALGCVAVGFAIWAMWQALQHKNTAKRTETLKLAAACGIGGCALFAFSAMYLFDIGASLSVSQLDALVTATGIFTALFGLWLAYYLPRRTRAQYQVYHDIRSAHRLLIAVNIATAGFVAFCVTGGLMLILLTYGIFAVGVVAGLIGLAGALVAMCAGLVAAFIRSKLATDAGVETWRQGRVRR